MHDNNQVYKKRQIHEEIRCRFEESKFSSKIFYADSDS